MGGRTLTGSFTKDPAMTNQMCWSICKQGGFTIAGTQNYNEWSVVDLSRESASPL